MLYMSMSTILIIGLVLLVILEIYLGFIMSKREHFFFLMVIMLVGLLLLGALMEYNSQGLEAVILSRKVAYLGNGFAEYFFFIFILEHFNYKKAKWLTIPLFLLHVLTYVSLLVTDMGYPYFYKECRYMIIEGNIGHLSITAGPMLYVHRALMAFYIVAIPVVCLQYFFMHKTDKRRYHQILSLISVVLLPAIGYVLMLTGITGHVDLTPVFFGFALIICYSLLVHNKMFDAVDFARENLISSMENAVMVLDYSMRVLYMNQKAVELFPDVNQNVETHNLVSKLCKDAVEQYTALGRKYNLSVSNIYDKKKIAGYTLVFSDVTDLANYADELEIKVQDKVSEIERIQQHVLMSFANMIEMRDGMTGQHVKRTTEYVDILAKELFKRGMYTDVLNEKSVEIIANAAALHDVGKIAISDIILQKPGKLTYEEFEKIKTHSEMGGMLIEDVLNEVGDNDYLQEAKKMAYYHHEKWNGEGYPKGLKGEEIPVSARIMALADVFDALISKRQYKDAYNLDKAFEIIRDSAGSHFDPEMATVFIEIRPEIEKVVNSFKDED